MPLKQLTKREQHLVGDAGEFDREVLRSAIAFYNALTRGRVDEGLPLRNLSNECFGWVPRVLNRRAAEERMDRSLMRWEGMVTPMEYAEIVGMLLHHLSTFGGIGEKRVLVLGSKLTPDEWLDEIVDGIRFQAKLRSHHGDTRMVFIPILTSLRDCIAYAITAIRIHKLESLVRACAYGREAGPDHYFLAEDKRQKFCSPEHSNLYRQKKWQARHGRKQK